MVNLHPATVHFPIALLLLANGAGLLYLYWRATESLRTLTWWPMVLGWLSVPVALLTGLLAQSGLPPQAPYRAILNWHITTGLLLWALYGLLLYWRWIHQGKQRRQARLKAGTVALDLLDYPPARWQLTLLFLIGILLIVVSGWIGGKLVYEWGVNVRL